MPQPVLELKKGQYHLQKLLARSSYGCLYQARGPQGAVALKLINRHRMCQAQPDEQGIWVESAEQEIAFLQQLSPWDQRHIARLLDTGKLQGLPVLALELLDGDLERHLRDQAHVQGQPQPNLPLDRVLLWLAQLNQALAKVHQYGWLYLDLKPANVLRQGERGLKLVDFGSASRSRLLDYRGTPQWQAPEQFFPAHGAAAGKTRYACDQRSDYFALGALLYFFLSGMRLRFGQLCAQAFRLHGLQAWQHVPSPDGGWAGSVLYADEAALFQRIWQEQLLARGFSAAKARALARDGLEFLCNLLACSRAGRPQHALVISAALQELRTALCQGEQDAHIYS